MKKGLKEGIENLKKMEREIKEIENIDVFDLSDEGVHIEKESVSDTVNTIKKSFLAGLEQ